MAELQSEHLSVHVLMLCPIALQFLQGIWGGVNPLDPLPELYATDIGFTIQLILFIIVSTLHAYMLDLG